MQLHSKAAERLKNTTVLIIDEATMGDRFMYEAIDALLRSIMQNKEPFGGKIMLLGEDFFLQQ